jgi:hypothetical protein
MAGVVVHASRNLRQRTDSVFIVDAVPRGPWTTRADALGRERPSPMKKLTLEVDDLRVESFETHAGMEERGTVHGLRGTAIRASGPSNTRS